MSGGLTLVETRLPRRRREDEREHTDRTTASASRPSVEPVGVSVHRLDQIAVGEPRAESAAITMLDEALTEPTQPLPYATRLEQHFGQPLGWVRVRNGPLTTEALDAFDAAAATRGADIFLRRRDAPVDVVAHEVSHALQSRGSTRGAAGILPADSPAEAEADRLTEQVAGPANRALPGLRAPVRPAEGLALQAIALLRRGSQPRGGTDPIVEPATVTPARAPAAPSTLTIPPSTTPAVAPSTSTEWPTPDRTPVSVEGRGNESTAEAFAPPPMPALTISPEQVAAQNEAAAAAGAALTGAATAGEVLHAYADAPPTVKAQQAAGLFGHLDAVLPAETAQWQQAVPSIDADLTGSTGEPLGPLRVEAPEAAPVTLEPTPPGAAPEPVLADVDAPQPYAANDRVTGSLARLTEPAPEQLADAIGDSLGSVQTTDSSVPRSPGPPPAIPLGGETDPGRIADQQAAGQEQAGAARAAATQAVVDGPGPERVQPISLHEAHPFEPVEASAAPTIDGTDGPDAYLALALPPEVQICFDEQQREAMAANLAEATATADDATVARDAARDEAVATAEQGAADLNRTAQQNQATAVTDARRQIQVDRQAAVDEQHAAVARVQQETDDRRRSDEDAIATRVAAEQQTIDDSYAQGERDIAAKVAEGEQAAEAKRQQAERDAANQSWWDRAVSFVKDALDALVSAIDSIFDAVRSAVNAALDGLKSFALSVIDRVANFVKDAIKVFGELLKVAVDGLIGQVFPELAARLNAAIDEAVVTAQTAVDAVADTLKAGINALVEGLRAGINAALNAFQAGLSLAVGLVGAALTGDWGALARKVLEAVLKLVGVEPEAFYAFVGRAQETFQLIIDDPLGFLSHLVDALVGGVQGFADRFGDHLQQGIIGWLTGTLGGAGITLPQTFDLMGVLDLARQILGLTWERLRAKAVKMVGEQNVARLEYIGSYLTTLITEGWSGLWSRIAADLSGLVDTVFNSIMSFLLDGVVRAMIKKLPLMFTPAGAIVQLIITAWNLYEFLRDQLSRIGAVVVTVVNSIGDIARGVLTAAIAKVEEVLGSLVPIVLDLLAKLLGLGNLSADVRKIIEKVQSMVDSAIDALITKVLGLFSGKRKPGEASPPSPPADPAAASAAGSTEPPLTDTFTVAGETHTLRAVGPDGEASLEMASGQFDKLVSRMNAMIKQLRKTYTTTGRATYVGASEAEIIDSKLGALATRTRQIVADIARETDKKKERKLITAGFTELRTMIADLRLDGATSTVLHAHHHAAAGPVISYGRQTWFEINPLVPESTGKGGKPIGPVPGVKILPDYQRGHLVAKSLGGPGTEDNLVAMAEQTNINRVGVVGVEDSLRYALGRFLTDHPEARPGYLFSYRVTANYRPDGGLQRELTAHGVELPTSEAELYAIAQSATSRRPTDPRLLATVRAPADPAAAARLAENVRRRLVWHFTPASISARVEVLATPQSYSAKIYQSATAPNHLGQDLQWVGP